MTITLEKPETDAAEQVLDAPQPPTAKTPAQPDTATSISHWLPGYCERLPGVCRGIALTCPKEGVADPDQYSLIASWPEGTAATRDMRALAVHAFKGLSKAERINTDDGSIDRLTMPITHQGQFLGALVVEADGLDYPQHRQLLSSINSRMPKKTSPEEAAGHRMAIVMDLLASCLDKDNSQSAAIAFVTELATRTGCDRVSFGRLNNKGTIQIVAMSNSANLAERSNLLRLTESAMMEAIDQDAAIMYPRRGSDNLLDREQATLSRTQGNSQVFSVPLAHAGKITGALTLERHCATKFGPGLHDLCKILAAVAGPILELKFRDDQSLLTRTGATIDRLLKATLGPRHAGRKLLAALTVVALVWMSFADGTYRVTAPAHLEGSITRAVVAPIDGFIASSTARAGDRVQAGDLLSQLDDSELKLERAKWHSESEQLRKQYRGALAAHDRVETTIVSARLERAAAQLELLDAQLSRTGLKAPFDGIVVAGDLSQLLGSPVQRGDILFEIAPLDDYRVVLEIDERDIGVLTRDQPGRIALEGLSGKKLPLKLTKITPVATARDGRNYFRVEAQVDADSSSLRPGMAGIAKIDAGERRLIWIWSHRITDWLRLQTWKFLP